MIIPFNGALRALGLAAALSAAWVQAGGVKLAVAERERHARAGEMITRTVELTREAATTATVRLAWTAAIPPAVLARGTLTATAPPRGRVAIPVRLRLPTVRRAVRLSLALRAECGAGPGDQAEAVDWVRVYPERLELPWAFLATRRIGALDPGGALAARLRRLGGRPEVQLSLRDAQDFTGDLLIVGEECFSSAAQWAQWREGLRRRGGPGASVVVLHQAFAAEGNRGGWAEPELTAAGRAWLRELEPDDLAGWRGGGALRGPWLPEPPGPCVPLAVAEKRIAALLVEPLGAGRILVRCQAPLLGRWEAEPACELLLNALLRRALDGAGKSQKNRRKIKGRGARLYPFKHLCAVRCQSRRDGRI